MNAGVDGQGKSRGGERAELEKDLARLEREHLEVLRAGLSVPGGVYFSQRLHELENQADLIRVRLGIPSRGEMPDPVLNRSNVTASFGGERDPLTGRKRETGRMWLWVGLLVGLACVASGVAVGSLNQWPLTSAIVIGIGAATFGAHVVMLLRAAGEDRKSRL